MQAVSWRWTLDRADLGMQYLKCLDSSWTAVLRNWHPLRLWRFGLPVCANYFDRRSSFCEKNLFAAVGATLGRMPSGERFEMKQRGDSSLSSLSESERFKTGFINVAAPASTLLHRSLLVGFQNCRGRFRLAGNLGSPSPGVCVSSMQSL